MAVNGYACDLFERFKGMVAHLSMPSHSKVCLTDGTTAPHADAARCEDDGLSAGSGDTDEPASQRIEFQVELNLHTDETDPPMSGWFEACLMRVAGVLGLERGGVSVAIVGDARMIQLHRQHKQEEGTTDVLTFDLRDIPITNEFTVSSADAERKSSTFLDSRRGKVIPDGYSAQDHVQGDLVICMDEAARQAVSRGHETRLEVLLYAVHGLLHLLGYDDHNPQDAEAMHRREDELLTAIGYGPVYSRDQREPKRGSDALDSP